MNIEEKLEIIIPTYNRKDVLSKTLENLLTSPVKDCLITVLDNNSTDGTLEYLKDLSQKYENLKFVKNKYNIGMAPNICKALLTAQKEYFWIVFDDTGLDFSHWDEIMQGLNSDADVVMTLNYYNVKSLETIVDKALVVLMLIFLFSGIFKTKLISEKIILQAYTDIYTVHPQLALIFEAVLHGKIALNKNAVAFPRPNVEFEKKEPYSFNRSAHGTTHFRLDKPVHFFHGFLNAIEQCPDKKLKRACIDTLFKKINGIGPYIEFNNLYFTNYKYHKVNYSDILMLLPLKYKIKFLLGTLKYKIAKLFFLRREREK